MKLKNMTKKLNDNVVGRSLRESIKLFHDDIVSKIWSRTHHATERNVWFAYGHLIFYQYCHSKNEKY